MQQKENQRIKVTKRMLKEGLLQLMETKSIQKISVSELCRASGINRVTFYNHYTVPADILTEIGDDMVRDILSLLKEKQIHRHASLQERVEFACEYLLQNKKMAKLVFQNNTPESEFALKLFHGQDEWRTASEKLASAYGEDGKDEDGETIMAVFTNNGDPPEGGIIEKGGLKSLRELTEQAGGSMIIQTKPAFMISIQLPKEDAYGI